MLETPVVFSKNTRPFSSGRLISLGADELATIATFEKASQSVVYITNSTIRRDFWSLNTFEVPQGSGSGFIWDVSGHIVTNFHVVYGADTIEVILDDQSTYEASIVGVDPDHDLAVLKISEPTKPLQPLNIGKSHNLRVGQKVLAIGNPFGLHHTLTTGVVSALGRSIKSLNNRTIEDVIQTDAAINPGNSGGPLLDSSGKLIGVNTQIYSPSGSSAGIGFAVPVSTVNRVIPQLIKYGKVIRPGIGISVIHDSIANRWGITGIIINRVAPNGPAHQAGLRGIRKTHRGRIELGDIITKVDGETVTNLDDLLTILDRHAVGDRISLSVKHRHQSRTVSVALSAMQ